MGDSEAALRAKIEAEFTAKFKARAEALDIEAVKLMQAESALRQRQMEAKENADHVRETVGGLTQANMLANKVAIENKTTEALLIRKYTEKDETISELTSGEKEFPKRGAKYTEILSRPSLIRRMVTIKRPTRMMTPSERRGLRPKNENEQIPRATDPSRPDFPPPQCRVGQSPPTGQGSGGQREQAPQPEAAHCGGTGGSHAGSEDG